MPCSDCADNDWNCPYPYCSMSSSRHWNVTRHIQRRHQGSGMPINENRFIHKMSRDPSIQKGFGSYRGATVMEAIAATSQKQEKKFDPFDQVLPLLRNAAEFTNLLKQFSPQPKSIPKFGSSPYGSLYNAGSPPFGVFNNNNLNRPNYSFNNGRGEVVGYYGCSCGVCLVNDPLPIYNRKCSKGLYSGQQETQAILSEHQCESQRVVKCSSLPQNIKEEIIINLDKNLPYTLLNTVNSWTNNCARLASHEIPPNVKIDPIDLFPKNEDHWSIRAIKKRETRFNSVEELKEFIVSASNRTLGIFRIHSHSQDKEMKVPYFIAITPTGSFPS